jgi:membrane protein required for colicin V production
MMPLTALDWIFLGALLLSCIIGLWRGFIQEAMSLAGWFAALGAAYALADWFVPMLTSTGLGEATRYALAFGLLFVGTLIVWSMLTAFIKKAVGAIGLGALDRLLGGLFGIVRGAVILVTLTLFVSLTPVDHSEFWQTSKAVSVSKDAAQTLKPLLPASVAAFIHSPNP